MKTPCCNKEIGYDEVWNLTAEDTFGLTNKNFTCPYCEEELVAFLDIVSIEKN